MIRSEQWLVPLILAALAIAGCGEKKSATTTTTDAMAAADDETTTTTDPMAPPEVVKPVEKFSIMPLMGNSNFSIRNIGETVVTIQRLVLNGIENDSDCDIKVFQQVAPGDAITVGPSKCGDTRSAFIQTENGRLDYDWTSSPQLKVGVHPDSNGETHLISVYNYGIKPVTVEVIVVNNRPSDPECSLKLFKIIDKKQTEVFEAHNCGTINDVDIKTDSGKSQFTFNNDDLESEIKK